jgi:predicted nucleotidyltransferase
MADMLTLPLPYTPGDTVLVGVVGSTAYGLTTATSDIDRLGVYIAPTRTVLGLRGPAATSNTVVSNNPDVAIHELGKFCTLALKANPTVLELLYCDRYDIVTDIGAHLIDLRDAFLSTDAVRSAYAGYALGQAKRLAARAKNGSEGFGSDLAKRTAKHGRHCRRLLLMGEQLLTTGHLQLDVSEHRDMLMAAGELAEKDQERFLEEFQTAVARFDTLESVLPDTPDFDRVNTFCVEARLAHL